MKESSHTQTLQTLLGTGKELCMTFNHVRLSLDRCGSVGHCPVNQKVVGSTPGQRTGLGCGFSPQSQWVQPTNRYFSLTLMFSPSLKIKTLKKFFKRLCEVVSQFLKSNGFQF